MRYFIQFSYFGKAYHGWQNQPNAITVQEVLEKALSTLLRKKMELVGAGRTDSGVHAREMFAHFDVDGIEDSEELTYRLNAFLPEDIAVKKISTVVLEAHARFDAIERTYEYWVVQEKNPFYADFAHLVKLPLNVDAMNESAQYLLEYDDFECFSKSNTDVKTFLCDVRKAFWEIKGDKLVFTISADRFLRNMVRAIVGTLLDVGLGKMKPEEINLILQSKDRGKAGVSVPAKGLYLTKVTYPKKIFNEQ
ncbi:tRNA pseudouridine(38-40) synthase TruA [Flagellimonas sp. S3867]|uniref:tRNA pseudouridine(38-40) synthase TruA n=1 Tax=Flagellimonas sp. S3867 TaxID=2768063 RepID=UPI00168313D6|nr:tRNA pseudouridine(38-40) synthase TruA [Flagellimonas sp. S3867]